ncbi:MAG: energy transducer TonB [Terriglobales bacterium]
MFSTLESNWDESARRGRATLASFTLQAFALAMLIVVSLIWVGGPPQVRWLQISAPASYTPQPQAPAQPAGGHHANAPVSNPRAEPFTAPPSIPLHSVVINDADVAPQAPDLPTTGFGNGHGPRTGAEGTYVPGGLGEMPVVMPPRPVAAKPLVVSHLAEANLLHRVQPLYPALARMARVQGSVELQAIISKNGTIENLVVLRGHPLLAAAAVEAVRQWRYRPYLLNNEPIEVETEITVNFTLSGS